VREGEEVRSEGRREEEEAEEEWVVSFVERLAASASCTTNICNCSMRVALSRRMAFLFIFSGCLPSSLPSSSAAAAAAAVLSV